MQRCELVATRYNDCCDKEHAISDLVRTGISCLAV